MLTRAMICTLLAATTGIAMAAEPAPHRLTPVPVQQVTIEDEFWSPKRKVWREVTIPDCFAKFENDGALANFDKVRDGADSGHRGATTGRPRAALLT